MRDGVSIVDTCKELEQRGGDVVGMNCFRGPNYNDALHKRS